MDSKIAADESIQMSTVSRKHRRCFSRFITPERVPEFTVKLMKETSSRISNLDLSEENSVATDDV